MDFSVDSFGRREIIHTPDHCDYKNLIARISSPPDMGKVPPDIATPQAVAECAFRPLHRRNGRGQWDKSGQL